MSPQETVRLYFEDAYRTEFEASVVGSFEHEGKPAVVLDETGFYPESGGQPSDRGTLDGVSVVDVVEAEGGMIVHVLDREIKASRVRGVIDWGRRFDHMQQHTGQHILSQCFVECLAGETMSFHLGDAAATLEIGLRAATDEDLARVEDRANAVVAQDLEVRTYFVPEEKLDTVPLRRPPKKSGVIRVVEVGGFDYSACGGTHCRRTGEVGLIKIVKSEKIRNNLRFEFLCGRRALLDYRSKNRALVAMASTLSVKEAEVAAAVLKLGEESRDSRKRLRRLEETLAAYEARELAARAEGRIVSRFWPDKTAGEAKLLALQLIRLGEHAALFAAAGPEGGRLIFASAEKLGLNMRELVPVVQALASARGGGSPSLVEMIVAGDADLEAILAAAADHLKSRLP